MKSSQRPRKDNHDLKIRKVRVTFTARQYFHLARPSTTISAAERLATKLYNKLMPTKRGPFKIIEVSPSRITIEEEGFRNTVSVDQVTLVPLAEYAEQQLVYTSKQSIDERDDKADETGGHTTAEDLADALHEYAVHCVMSHKGESDNVRYVVRLYGYTFAEDRVEPLEHIPEHFITCYWGRLNGKNEVGQQ